MIYVETSKSRRRRFYYCECIECAGYAQQLVYILNATFVTRKGGVLVPVVFESSREYFSSFQRNPRFRGRHLWRANNTKSFVHNQLLNRVYSTRDDFRTIGVCVFIGTD